MIPDQTRFGELSEEHKHDNQSAPRTTRVIPTFSDVQLHHSFQQEVTWDFTFDHEVASASEITERLDRPIEEL